MKYLCCPTRSNLNNITFLLAPSCIAKRWLVSLQQSWFVHTTFRYLQSYDVKLAALPPVEPAGRCLQTVQVWSSVLHSWSPPPPACKSLTLYAYKEGYAVCTVGTVQPGVFISPGDHRQTRDPLALGPYFNTLRFFFQSLLLRLWLLK